MAELTDAQKVMRNDTGKRMADALETLAQNSEAPIGLGMTGATVGQVPVVKTVDANGVPTSYEPGAGGGGALPAGGTDGDVLVKSGTTDYDATWKKTPPQMGSLATIETSPVENPNGYNMGDYLVYNGQLYVVIATTISQGQTLTPGGNIEATSVCGAFGRYQEYTLTKATEAANWTIFESHACRCGNIAFIQVVAWAEPEQDTSEVVMFRLPDALKPPYVVKARFATFDQKYDCNVNINVSGEFRVARLPQQDGAIRINVSYPVTNEF